MVECTRSPVKYVHEFYIGQTGKDLNMRIKQHKYSIRYGQESNALFVHLRDFGHSIDWKNANSLVPCKGVTERNIIESSFIKQSINNSINMSTGLYKLDPLIIKAICEKYKFDKNT